MEHDTSSSYVQRLSIILETEQTYAIYAEWCRVLSCGSEHREATTVRHTKGPLPEYPQSREKTSNHQPAGGAVLLEARGGMAWSSTFGRWPSRAARCLALRRRFAHTTWGMQKSRTAASAFQIFKRARLSRWPPFGADIVAETGSWRPVLCKTLPYLVGSLAADAPPAPAVMANPLYWTPIGERNAPRLAVPTSTAR